MPLKFILYSFCIIFFYTSCSFHQPSKTKSVVVVFKTPNMKFYDNGFVTYYKNYTHLQVFNVGKIVLNLEIYKNKICQSTFRCLNSTNFNKKYLNSSYKDEFLFNLFRKRNINFKDKKNKILIKVREVNLAP